MNPEYNHEILAIYWLLAITLEFSSQNRDKIKSKNFDFWKKKHSFKTASRDHIFGRVASCPRGDHFQFKPLNKVEKKIFRKNRGRFEINHPSETDSSIAGRHKSSSEKNAKNIIFMIITILVWDCAISMLRINYEAEGHFISFDPSFRLEIFSFAWAGSRRKRKNSKILFLWAANRLRFTVKSILWLISSYFTYLCLKRQRFRAEKEPKIRSLYQSGS